MAVNIDLDQIIAGVTAHTPEDRPLERLSAATNSAARLESMAHHLVAHFVEEARLAGASWTEIGKALGVTRQAAQQRFVPASGIELESAMAAAAVPFSNRARTALENARTVATENRHRTIDDLHILLGLLNARTGGTVTVVKSLGRRMAELRKTARMHLAARGPRRAGVTTTLGRTGLRTLHVATREALRTGGDVIGTEHLLLALAGDVGSAAGQALSEAGVSAADLRKAVTRLTTR
ncbi:MAG TPA: Clp protease N-terminal domain-containing protein [Actinopolymorphaceae bacterium]